MFSASKMIWCFCFTSSKPPYRQRWLTRVVRQVREGDRLALHLVREPPQDHADLHLLRKVLLLVGRGLEHDGDLPVHVCLRKLPARLPRASSEDDLDVICGSTTRKARAIKINEKNTS